MNIILTEEKRKKLEKLWFIYGNDGKKHTHNNHRFIQNILEHGEDTRDFYKGADKKRSMVAGIKWESIMLTDECVNEVDKILKG